MSKNNGLKIDPCTGDYVLENGKPVRDESINQPVYIRLKAKRNTWLYAPNDKWGSDFHLIKKSRTNRVATREISTAEKALEPLIEDGRAADLDVIVNNRLRGQTELKVSIIEDTGEDDEAILIPVGD